MLLIESFGVISIIVLLFVIFIFSSFIAITKYYKKCPANKILVIYGNVGKQQSVKCIHGGAAFIIPFLQDYAFLDLTPITVDIDLKEALSKENIRINTPSNFTIGISTTEEIMKTAAQRLLNMNQSQIAELAKDIILGQFRGTIATMAIEEINSNRELFQSKILNNVEEEIKKVGLQVLNVNIKDITDASKYIEALGQKAAAEAIQKASIEVAVQERDGAIGVVEANREKRISVANANAEAVSGESLAEKNREIAVANANAEKLVGQNLAKQQEAESDSQLRIIKAELEANAIVAEKTKTAKADEESYAAQKQAELARKERDLAKQLADIVPIAEAEKSKIIIAAQAEREKLAQQGTGEGEKIKNQLTAEAQGVLALLTAKAEGLEKIVAAAGGDVKNAFMLLLIDQLPKIVELQTNAVSKIKFDKVIAYDGGTGNGGISGFINSLPHMLPQLHDMLNSAGVSLPTFLGSIEEEESKKIESKKNKGIKK